MADLNGDGKPDIAAGFTNFVTPVTEPGFAAAYLQDPANPGTFLVPVTYSVPANLDPLSIAVGDLNGDGKPDIVTANSTRNSNFNASTGVSVLLQDPAHPGQFLAPVNYAPGTDPFFVAIGDLNGDGKPDLAIADLGGVSILFQDPSKPGIFLPPTPINSGAAASSVAIADLNGDHKLDLVVTTGPNVLVLLQNPASPGTFFMPVSYSAGLQPIFVAVGDLSGDGRPDLAVANLGSPTDGTAASVSVLLQDPSAPGTFLPATNYPTDSRSVGVAIADLNGDGKPDLAVANSGNLDFSGNSVSVLLQNPTLPGSFQARTNYPGTGGVNAVAVADLNGDGAPDLAIADGGIVAMRLQDRAHPGSFLAETVIQ